MSSWESIIPYNKQSSAKSLSDDVIFLEMSLMYSKNIRRPSTVPCGTPDVTITFLNILGKTALSRVVKLITLIEQSDQDSLIAQSHQDTLLQ